MNVKTFLLLGTLLPALAGCGGSSPPADPNIRIGAADRFEFHALRAPATAYHLGTGDEFEVQFLFERSLNTQVKVRPDGFVALPILGEIPAAGRTPGELDSLLTAAYAGYYRDPELTVNVVRFAGPEVYVLGEVRAQRAVPLTPGMTILHALAVAGGTTPNSKLGSVILIRRVGDGDAYARRVDLDSFLKGDMEAWDLYLAPSDIIYVPETFVSRLERFVKQLFGGLTPLPNLYLRGWEAFHTDEVYRTFIRTESGSSESTGQ